ncbi:hypothetical protein [Bailinhaonella thermotolerans]|nr:hypothetical protein [Bailinhaonella thermotolerans]
MAHLHFWCWNCDTENLLHGEGCDCCDLVTVPTFWDCWACGAENETPGD